MSANASRDDDSFDITWPGDGVETLVDEAWDRLFEFIPECLVIQEYDLIEDRTWKMFKHSTLSFYCYCLALNANYQQVISALDHNIRAIECFKISCTPSSHFHSSVTHARIRQRARVIQYYRL